MNIWWIRRDIRLEDNAALYYALKQNIPVQPVFIFDTNILNDLPSKADKRVVFIHRALHTLDQQLRKLGSSLYVYHGTPTAAFEHITQTFAVKAVHTNRDYEPYARQRDNDIHRLLAEKGIAFHTYKDQVIFEQNEVLKDNNEPYTIFTPYSKKWKSHVTPFHLKAYPTGQYFFNLHQTAPHSLPTLADIGFEEMNEVAFPSEEVEDALIQHYNETRDFPSQDGTSRLSVHLRFGTISIRALARRAKELNEVFLNELIWRDFYHMILWHFPYVVGHAFKKEYDAIIWRNNEREYEAWKSGQTGYPIVDAGMRELNETGFMHNRVRMIVASFLTKHLLIDWRWGEAYFAEKLLDYDLAANNGGWQWAAGCGCDAAPYFRVFNPSLQTEKFDKQLKYIRKWVPELDELTYPRPIVVHEQARKRVLEAYAKALKK
ncbi:deoxyribodipyrimidine photo-lyase [Chitinophaga skermanii]|uniref:Deoxyribodipyrimidine photo-lyase n=1 Tax=Chitinophaga skermanii TaxID=331697 RepID=A0A327Q5G2_9BACT|nr:deoxyribodipyrimidine photo-lyase [Chitinophaga skermanii]RAI98452.1 deoxyribodipyrimidine photo-lyase [Chitinophaga skermanii]